MTPPRLIPLLLSLPLSALAAQSPLPRESWPWSARVQAEDGSFADATGKPGLEETCVLAMSLVGNGYANGEGRLDTVCGKALDWLVAKQRPDGTWEPAGPGATRRLGMIAFTLVHAVAQMLDLEKESAQGKRRETLRTAAVAALKAMHNARNKDVGFGDMESPSDVITTTWCLAASASAEFHKFEVPVPAAKLVTWFDGREHRTGLEAAAELWARFLADPNPKKLPPLRNELCDVILAKADASAPQECFFATIAMVHMGGRRWRTWNKRVETAVLATQIKKGEAHGSWSAHGKQSVAVTTGFSFLTLQAHYRISRLLLW